MGVMRDPGRLIVTPHPVTLEGQRNVAAELQPGETLGAFLARNVPEDMGDGWECRINGIIVPHEVMDRVRPKPGTVIEVRSIVGENALYIIAFAVLTYFTFGAAAAGGGILGGAAGAGTFYGASGLLAAGLATATFVAGSVLINKVLGPKLDGPKQAEQNSVYSIGAARNRARPYDPVGILFGRVRIAPDLLSQPYTWYEGGDQYVGMMLTPGINVHSVEELYNGDTPLSSYEGVQVYNSGFPGMPDQRIPLYSNADTIQGGELSKDRTWVERTTPAGTVRIQINLEFILGDRDSKGRPYRNIETVEAQYRVTGATNWMPLVTRNFSGTEFDPRRETIGRDLMEGQYDVRVRILGLATDGGGSNGRSQWQWTTMTAVQADDASYNGIPRIGVRIKATGQLNGAPDELRCVAISRPTPVWTGPGWETEHTSNPGAMILQYARGISSGGERVAGMGLPEDMIDIASLQAFMAHCAAEGYTYDWWVTDARSHDDVLNTIARAGFGQISWAGGRLAVVWAAADQPLGGVVNMATIKQGAFQVDYTLANAADGIEATYYDAETWESKTLRVPAPGVEVMLNPAQLQLEGVTSEARAAEMARWHLAQSLYQQKDITYSTDIEHLSYSRMSLLALQHDLTQWGYGGRVQGASVSGTTVTLTLDEPVPAPANGNAFIGLRIPGERVYRTFGIAPFTGESRELTLTGAWPSDAALPGDTANNPAHDTIWIYDFKQTPGLRCRVVQIEPESDLKGARVAVVPEGPEYWHYVKTGEYVRAPSGSLLNTRPVASNLAITEREVVQGDTVFTELVATFDIIGPVGQTVVLMADEDGIMREVAVTPTRTAVWRIPGPGTYTITVRPFSPGGSAGIAITRVYSTVGAGSSPVLVDLFDVDQRSGGVRLYTWGWLSETLQSADFAGVEIRYASGELPAPVWADMTPLGEDGYFTAPFEAVIPESGVWTFACRSRNTSGVLSTGARVITRTLQANLGEQIGAIDADIRELVEAQEQADQAIYDNAQAILAEAAERARETGALALRQSGLEEALGSVAWRDDVVYPMGAVVNHEGRLWRAIDDVPENIEPPNAGYWLDVGSYAYSISGGLEAQAVRLDTFEQDLAGVEDDLSAEVTARTALGVQLRGNYTGTDLALVSQGLIANEKNARVAADSAQVSETNALRTRVGTAEANIVTNRQAQIDGDAINAQAIEQVSIAQGEMQASVTQVMEVQAGANLVNVQNGRFESIGSGWSSNTNGVGPLPPATQWAGVGSGRAGSNSFQFSAGTGASRNLFNAGRTRASPGEKFSVRAYTQTAGAPNAGSTFSLGIRTYNAEGGFNSSLNVSSRVSSGSTWTWEGGVLEGVFTAPDGTHEIQVYLQSSPNHLAGAVRFDDITVERVSPLEANLMARHTVALDVNGNVSGTVNENDGVRSVFSIIANVFRVISSGTAGLEWQDGYLRAYAASIQLILGINFGASSNLCFWYGPNVGANNCTKANGTIWFDNGGDAFFGGRFTAGTLATAWNANISINSEYSFAHQPSTGRPKSISTNASIRAQAFFAGNQTGSYPARTWTWRRRIYRNGTLIRTDTVTGTSGSEYILPGDDRYPGITTPTTVVTDSGGFGQVTFNDTSTLTGTITYRTVFDRSAGQQPYNGSPIGTSNTTVVEE